jgi:predicted ArsR family transcriptional regulator
LVGLLDVDVDARGTVGRPQHVYSLAADAPSLGLEPPAFPLLAAMLAGVAVAAGASPDDAGGIGRQQGRVAARERTADESCVAALAEELHELGFDPAVGGDDDGTVVAFAHCPFRELAEAFPELVCHLHRGMVEGFVEEHGDGTSVVRFHTLVDRDPCQVALSAG